MNCPYLRFHTLNQQRRILDSIAAEQVDPDLTELQKRELDRRIDDYEANPDEVMTWTEVKASFGLRLK